MIAVLYTRPAAASLLRLSFSRHVARAHDRSIFGVGLLALAPWALVFAATRERQLLLMVVSGVADAADVALHPSAYTQPVIVLLMLKSASQATDVGSVRLSARPERLRITAGDVPGVPPALAREPPRRVESRQPCGKRRPLRPPRRCSRRPLPRPWRRNPRLWRSRGRVAAAQLDVALHPSAYVQPVIVLLMLKSVSQAIAASSVKGLRRPDRRRITGSFVPGPSLRSGAAARLSPGSLPVQPQQAGPAGCRARANPRLPRLIGSGGPGLSGDARSRRASAPLWRTTTQQRWPPPPWYRPWWWRQGRHQGRVGRLRLRRRGARLRLRRHHLGRRRRRNGRMRRHGRSGEIRWEHLLCRMSLLVRHVRNG